MGNSTRRGSAEPVAGIGLGRYNCFCCSGLHQDRSRPDIVLADWHTACPDYEVKELIKAPNVSGSEQSGLYGTCWGDGLHRAGCSEMQQYRFSLL